MPKTNQNFDLYQGDTRQILITLDATVPPFITSRWWIGRSPGATGADVLLKKTPTVVNGNVLQISLEVEDFTNLQAGKLYHEAEVTTADNRSYTVSVGEVTIYPTMKN